jgi:hypothetical protein
MTDTATDATSTGAPSVLLAELEIWHTRPLTPTRRLSLGHMVLPCDPAPGFGGLLIGAVIARHAVDLDDDLVPDVHRLVSQIQRGERVVQPRLRHRFQVDRHGMALSRHRVIGTGEDISFELDSQGSPMQQVLGAIYALERLDLATRRHLEPVVMKSLSWRGPLGAAFIGHLAGSKTSSLRSLADPRAWALDILGFPSGTTKPSKREVMERFRRRLREVHPDHGGDESTASSSIGDLSEARRILGG